MYVNLPWVRVYWGFSQKSSRPSIIIYEHSNGQRAHPNLHKAHQFQLALYSPVIGFLVLTILQPLRAFSFICQMYALRYRYILQTILILESDIAHFSKSREDTYDKFVEDTVSQRSIEISDSGSVFCSLTSIAPVGEFQPFFVFPFEHYQEL